MSGEGGIPDIRARLAVVEAGGGSGAAWGGIGGTLANQTDLQAALNAKLSAAQVQALIDATPFAGVDLGTFN